MSKSVESKDILKGLQTETLQDLYLRERPEQRGQKLNKASMVTEMTTAIDEAGVKSLFANMPRDHLAALVDKSGVKLKEGESKNSKVVLSRRLANAIAESNLQDFLTEHADEELLHEIAIDLGIDAEDEKKEGLIKEITAVVRSMALQAYFGGFDVDLLQYVADDLKLKTHSTQNKRKLVDSIVTKSDVEKEPKAKKQKIDDGGKKKKPIAKGITYEEIFQHYYVNEVRDYCKEKGLKTSGKKPVLIKRILAYLNGDEETTKPKAKGGRGRKAGKGKGGKKSAAAKEEKSEAKEEEEAK